LRLTYLTFLIHLPLRTESIQQSS